MKLQGLILSLALSIVPVNSALSQELPTGFRDIVQLGCHISDGECFVVLSGDAFGDEFNCASTQARFFADTKKNVNGTAILALLMSAQTSNKKVTLNISDCFSDIAPGRPNVPTFDFINIRDPKDVNP